MTMRTTMTRALRGLVTATALALFPALAFPTSAQAAGAAPAAPAQSWNHAGLFGTFDRGAQQRGFQVYKEVCASCHSLDLVAFRHLTQIGYTADQVKAIAATYEVEDGPNDEGEMFTRPGRPSDTLPAPFANDQAARAANNGALPPDLSLMVKARPGGADYLYGLLVGYADPPADFKLQEGMNYNTYFPGHQIAMAPPLDDEAVEYADGTKPTLARHARDVTVFLAWAAEPELEDRKRMGIKVMLFLILLTAMLYALKRAIWRDLH